MKILTDKMYKDLLREIEVAETSADNERIRNSALNRKIDEIETEKKTLLQNNVDLLEQNGLLKVQMESMNLSISRLSSNLRKVNGRCGGLTKQNNKLVIELKIAREKINNYRLYSRKNHIKMTVNQYDKRLPSVNTIRKK